jgi:WD40 repeat protein
MVGVAPDGREFATAGDDGFVRVWDWRTSKLLRERQVASGHIAGLDYSGDGKHLVVGERSGLVDTIDAETLQPDAQPVDVGLHIVLAFASPDGRRAIALGYNDEFALVDFATGEMTHKGDAGFAPFASDFSPDGRRVAVTGGLAGQVRLLDVETGRWLTPTKIAHSGLMSSVEYAPDGETFATAGTDGKVALWNGETGAPLGSVLVGRPDVGLDLQYLSGGSMLIASGDGSISRWNTTTAHSTDVACQIAGRNLTHDEWRDALGSRPYHETCPSTEH